MDQASLSPNIQCDKLLNGHSILQDKQRFMFGIDAILLADFASRGIKRGNSVIDLGTGTGIIPLILDTHSRAEFITALEVQSESAKLAAKSVALNALENKIKIVEDDLKNVESLFAKHSFNVVTCNPPYMPVSIGQANPNDAKAIARHEILCNLEDVITASSYLLHDHGSFFMIHRPERLPEIMSLCLKNKMQPKVMQLIVPFENKEPTMVMIEARKDAKPDLKILPQLVVYEKPGEYSESVKAIYKSITLEQV